MKVLSIIHYPVFGGPHNRNTQVAPFLESKNIETIVLLPDEPGNAVDRLCKAGVEVITIPLSRIRAKVNPLYHIKLFLRFWFDVKRIRSVIRERNINIVQINGLVNPHGAIAARLEGVPVVWQILDTYPPMMLRRLVMFVVKRLATVVMCTGREVAEEHPGATGFHDRLVLFYPPVNIERFTTSDERREQARQLLGIPCKSFVIGNVGNINLQKGHRTFIKAAAKLKKRISDVKFVILGAQHDNHRDYIDGLWREAQVLGVELGDALIVVDPGDRVAELEAAFDVFWMTSEPRSEGIPTAMEEAMALEIPIVSTRVGSIEEVIVDSQAGFVVNAYDADNIAESTYKLFMDKKLLCTMGTSAGDFALKNFNIEACANSHLRAYQLALEYAK